MLKTITKWTVFFYSLAVIALGAIGYFQAGSIVSLALGGGIGFLILLSSAAMFAGFRGGSYSALALTLLLVGAFAYRYAANKHLLPALMAVLSTVILIFLLLQLKRCR